MNASAYRVAVITLCLAVCTVYGDTVFQTGFDYAVDPLLGAGDIIWRDATNGLNGATNQIGTWRGSVPFPAGDTSYHTPGTKSLGMQDISGDTALLLDRPTAHAHLWAEFTENVDVDGATVTFDASIRRSQGGGSHAKDIWVRGWDSAGDVIFYLKLSGNGNEAGEILRVGIVTNGVTQWDLPGATDADNDLNNGTNLATIAVAMSTASYTVRLQRGGIDWTSSAISYDGAPSELVLLQFTGQGGSSHAVRSGFMLDDVQVTGTPVDRVVWEGVSEWWGSTNWTVGGVPNQSTPSAAGHLIQINSGTVRKTENLPSNASKFEFGGTGALNFTQKCSLWWSSLDISGGFPLTATYISLNNAIDGNAPSMVNMSAGSVTLSAANALRTNVGFDEIWFNFRAGSADNVTITQTDSQTSSADCLSKRVAEGYFRLDGVRIDPTVDGSDVAALNAELETLALNDEWLVVTQDGNSQILTIGQPPQGTVMAVR